MQFFNKTNSPNLLALTMLGIVLYLFSQDPIGDVEPLVAALLAIGFGVARFQRGFWLPAALCMIAGTGLYALLFAFKKHNMFMIVFYPLGLPLIYLAAHGLSRLIGVWLRGNWHVVLSNAVLLFGGFLLFIQLSGEGFILAPVYIITLSAAGYWYYRRQGFHWMQILMMFFPMALLYIALQEFGDSVFTSRFILLSVVAPTMLGSLLGFLIHRYPKGRYALAVLMLALIAGNVYASRNILHADNSEVLNETAPDTPFRYDGDTLQLSNFRGKVVVMDFWNTGCGPCYKKFPELEQLYQQYSNRSDVAIMAFNVPLRSDTLGQAEYKIGSKGYTFKTAVALDKDDNRAFSVTGYPTLLIIDKAGKVRYRGALETRNWVENNTPKLIDELLK